MANNWENINTDDYDIYNVQTTPSAQPGSPTIDGSGHIVIPEQPFFPLSTLENSTMDKDPNNTGPTTDFWDNYPLTIDINGYIFYYDENTGINVRGPMGAPQYVSFDSLTPEQIETLKGTNGVNGINGRDGVDGEDGTDGLDAYHLWLNENGYTEQDHPIETFYQYLAGYIDIIVKEGDGVGSLITNFNGEENTATGRGSFASGFGTAANGDYSFTAGYGTIADYDYQFAIGKYNVSKPGNLFEIGNGVASTNRSTIFEVTNGGSVVAAGSITDGTGNILGNKVDKIPGKSLSTNDFNNNYKSFIDNYVVEDMVVQNSNNPVKSSGIYLAIEEAKASIISKPTIEPGTSNTNFHLLSYVDTGEYFEQGIQFNDLTWNPAKNNFVAGDSNTTSIFNNLFVYGTGLSAAASHQILLGKFNIPSATDVFQISNGSSANSPNNLLSLSADGNLTVATDVIVTEVVDNTTVTHSLKGKQDILTYDSAPTALSTNPVSSGGLYNWWYNDEKLDINQDISDANSRITVLNNSLNDLNSQVANIINTKTQLIDDATGYTYTIGVLNGELYIQLYEAPVEPEEEEEDTR